MTLLPASCLARTPIRSLLAAACATVLMAACGGSDGDGASTPPPAPAPEPTPTAMTLRKIGGFAHTGGESSAEITAYDPASKRLFVVNGALGTVDVLDLADPAAPAQIGTLTLEANESANSVAVRDGVVAVAVQAAVKTDPGRVVFYNAATLAQLASVTVGAQPDMLTFTPDGKTLLTANEGEPNGYGQPDSVDPEGSVSVIDVSALTPTSQGAALPVRTAGFAGFNGQLDALRAAGVRIYGPNATVAQDLEPEYIAVSSDSKTAYVTLQENNALAIVDIASASVTAIKPLGLKDHSLPGNGLDASDEDGGTNTNSGTPAVKIVNRPVKGMYQPDAIAYYTVDGKGYLVTANEGDAREWPGLTEESRVRAYCSAAGLDPTVFPDATLLFDSNLGRLTITTVPNGGRNGKNAGGQCNELLALGGRSFSVWSADGDLVWDSGDQLERHTAALDPAIAAFNSSNGNNNLDDRSDNKGPEPEGVVLATFGAKTYAFIGLERVGGVMVYDVTAPTAPTYVTYLNTRSGQTGDLGPEGLTFIPAKDSPNGQPLLVVGHEVSGTTTILQIDLSY
ncbi:MAG TPA: choice-of-anchor I family protein [Burkholderiaceae bacterium]|nr:choice-of-anchor I family protein [Burkholderiaceae bacterium]